MTSKEVFQKFVPKAAVDYCNDLYEKNGFELKVKKSRTTKLGDFRVDFRSKKLTITINNDLNPYSFLITYLHEIAHLVTFKEYRNKVLPHGKEWKVNFKKVSLPILNENVFPKEVLLTLKNYLMNPKASSCADPILYQVLRKYDLNRNDQILLQSVVIGGRFEFNQKKFIKMEKKRTRSLCQEILTGRKYLISELAQVKVL